MRYAGKWRKWRRITRYRTTRRSSRRPRSRSPSGLSRAISFTLGVVAAVATAPAGALQARRVGPSKCDSGDGVDGKFTTYAVNHDETPSRSRGPSVPLLLIRLVVRLHDDPDMIVPPFALHIPQRKNKKNTAITWLPPRLLLDLTAPPHRCHANQETRGRRPRG